MSDFKVFDYMEKHDYEQLVYIYDKPTGLKGVIAIHDTTLGPALGGTRIWNYATEEEAVIDVMRLARGMTYKAAAAGLNLGGGKCVLIGDATKVKSEAYFRALGRYVQSLNGRYITAEDVNTGTKDMNYIHMETDYVVGLEGKSGNPSPVTAKGAFYGIKSCLKYKFKDDDISKYTYAIQGVGQTGSSLIGFLKEENAKKIYFTDINPKNIEIIKKQFPDIEYVDPSKFYGLKVDVLVPCALGGVFNSDTIPQIKASIIAGTANNVLLDEDIHGPMIKEKGILYAPDFVINAGGLINVYHELEGYSYEKVMAAVKLIGDRLTEIFKIADEQNIHTQLAAKLFAKKRIASIATLHSNYIKR